MGALTCQHLVMPLPQDALPWEPYLTDEEVQRAEGYYGTGARLRRVAAKLLAGEPIQVRTAATSPAWAPSSKHELGLPASSCESRLP
jgi:hypothetical protein